MPGIIFEVADIRVCFKSNTFLIRRVLENRYKKISYQEKTSYTNSSMDTKSEEKIISNIKDIQKDAALVVVSHRFSTVIKADLVYFLVHPENVIVGRGSDLLEQDTGFRDLFKSQMGK